MWSWARSVDGFAPVGRGGGGEGLRRAPGCRGGAPTMARRLGPQLDGLALAPHPDVGQRVVRLVGVEERAEPGQALRVVERRLPLARVVLDVPGHVGVEVGADAERVVQHHRLQVVEPALELVEPGRGALQPVGRADVVHEVAGRSAGSSPSSSRSSASRTACWGRMPPLPATYRFQPRSVAMTPTSFDWASAHSRAHPDTASLILCGARRPRYRSSRRIAMPTESCTPKRHHVSPDARLHRAHGLAVGVARLEAGLDEPPPDGGELVDPGAEQVDPLAARDLGVQVEVAGDLAEDDELGGRDLAARHPGHDRVGAVALHVGEEVVVGVLQRRLLAVEDVAGAERGQHRGDGRLADLAAGARCRTGRSARRTCGCP